MEQEDLQPRNLVPYLGSRAKVSEVLSGKRPLTLAMIRALHQGLGVPAEALLKESAPTPKRRKLSGRNFCARNGRTRLFSWPRLLLATPQRGRTLGSGRNPHARVRRASWPI
jgi:transcriptional regulator with XRE-family HTH domain